MKTLSIQQPWASLIACGIKDVENRTWETKYRGKILIHASSKKVPKNFLDMLPIEWANEITNAINMGTMPDLPDLPTGAIIGYVDLTDCKTGMTDSLWDGGEDIVKLMLANAHLFDKPITGIKGKLNLWEYDMDETNLPPAHKVESCKIKLEGKKLSLQYEKSFFDDLMNEEGCIALAPTEAIDNVLLNRETGMAKDVESVTVHLSDGTIRSYKLPEGVWVGSIQDEKGNAIMVPSLYEESVELQMYYLSLGEEIASHR